MMNFAHQKVFGQEVAFLGCVCVCVCVCVYVYVCVKETTDT